MQQVVRHAHRRSPRSDQDETLRGNRLVRNGRIVVLMVLRRGWRQAIAMASDINLLDLDIYETGGLPHEQFAWLPRHAPV